MDLTSTPCHLKRCSRPVDGRIGVLALQGDVSEHIDAFARAGDLMGKTYEVIPVRSSAQLDGCTALAIPGGESTTIVRLIDKNGMREAITAFQGGIFATCAGMVVTAASIPGENRFIPLGIADTEVNRNAFGRQRESFEADIMIDGLSEPFHAIFIRAPVITRAGPGVGILASVSEGIIAARSGRHLILSFHPEIGGDLRLHTLFLSALS